MNTMTDYNPISVENEKIGVFYHGTKKATIPITWKTGIRIMTGIDARAREDSLIIPILN